MFTLDTKGSVYDTIKNRFTLHLPGCKLMNGRIHIRISPFLVSFFYYDSDYCVDLIKEEFVKDNTSVKEVGSISLTLPQNTGNDILNFPQTINNLNLFKENDTQTEAEKQRIIILRGEIAEYNNLWKKRFWGFPFLDSIEEQPDKERQEEDFRTLLRACLLSFIYEFEDRQSDFGESPIYDEVRDKLRKSDVYNLLSAKLHYILYLTDNPLVDGNLKEINEGRYVFYAKEFADRLMDNRVNKVIPPHNYKSNDDGEEKQGWFDNPEEELNGVLKRAHKATYLTTKKNNSKSTSPEIDKLISKIRAFFYAKHAVYYAISDAKRKNFIWAHRMLFGLNSVFICFLLLFTESAWNFCFKDNSFSAYATFGIGVLILSVIFLFVSSAIPNRKGKWFDVFLPKIIFAEVTAWLTIGIAEPLVKSLLWVEPLKIFVAILIILALICFLLVYKVYWHSPYSMLIERLKKVGLILNYSVFLALILGFIMQGILYDNMLRSSNVLSEGVYKSHFDKVGGYLQRLSDLEKSIDDYRIFARDYEFGSTQYSGDNRGSTSIAGNLKLMKNGTIVDSITMTMENSIRYGTHLNSSIGSNIPKYHVAAADNIKKIAGEIRERVIFALQEQQKDSIALRYDLCLERLISSIDTVFQREIISKNISTVNGEMSILKEEMRLTKQHMMDSDYDSLIKWATRGYSSTPNGGVYVTSLVREATQKKCCFIGPFGKRFFPQLLLLHTLIVLVLTFVSQLFISSEAVTKTISGLFENSSKN